MNFFGKTIHKFSFKKRFVSNPKRRFSSFNKSSDIGANNRINSFNYPEDDYLNRSNILKKNKKILENILMKYDSETIDSVSLDEIQDRLIAKIWVVITQKGFVRKVILFLFSKIANKVSAYFVFFSIFSILIL